LAFPNQFLNYRFISRNASNSFILKIIFVTIIFSAARLRYCFAWLMVDFRALLLDSDIRHKRRRYSRGQNIGIAKVEFANCQSEAMSYWNISWLRDDFYLRALEAPTPTLIERFVSRRLYSTLLTRCMGAFWHGFYPGYCMSFISSVLQFQADVVGRKYLRPFFTSRGQVEPSLFYTLVGMLHSSICLNYYAV